MPDPPFGDPFTDDQATAVPSALADATAADHNLPGRHEHMATDEQKPEGGDVSTAHQGVATGLSVSGIELDLDGAIPESTPEGLVAPFEMPPAVSVAEVPRRPLLDDVSEQILIAAASAPHAMPAGDIKDALAAAIEAALKDPSVTPKARASSVESSLPSRRAPGVESSLPSRRAPSIESSLPQLIPGAPPTRPAVGLDPAVPASGKNPRAPGAPALIHGSLAQPPSLGWSIWPLVSVALLVVVVVLLVRAPSSTSTMTADASKVVHPVDAKKARQQQELLQIGKAEPDPRRAIDILSQAIYVAPASRVAIDAQLERARRNIEIHELRRAQTDIDKLLGRTDLDSKKRDVEALADEVKRGLDKSNP